MQNALLCIPASLIQNPATVFGNGNISDIGKSRNMFHCSMVLQSNSADRMLYYELWLASELFTAFVVLYMPNSHTEKLKDQRAGMQGQSERLLLRWRRIDQEEFCSLTSSNKFP